MKIITKRIKVISMTLEEHEKFIDCMMAAKEGHTSHYAEAKLADGSFLGVNVLTKEEQCEREKEEMRENDARQSRGYMNGKR
jgi:hypothetical protein